MLCKEMNVVILRNKAFFFFFANYQKSITHPMWFLSDVSLFFCPAQSTLDGFRLSSCFYQILCKYHDYIKQSCPMQRLTALIAVQIQNMGHVGPGFKSRPGGLPSSMSFTYFSSISPSKFQDSALYQLKTVTFTAHYLLIIPTFEIK